MPEKNIDLSDENLFGNMMAQHEDEEVFKSYVYARKDFSAFWDSSKQMHIVSAVKGSGKSALCRLAGYKIKKKWPENICLLKYDSDISPEVNSGIISAWVKAWKKEIIRSIASAVGEKIGFAWGDDSMTLIEEAKKGGFRKRSIIDSIVERMKISKIPFSPVHPAREISQEFLARATSQSNKIWLMIDEADQHFDGSEVQKKKLVSMFLACSELFQKIPQLNFRLTIRPNVWATLVTEFSSISAMKQYVEELAWSDSQIKHLLAKRIDAYLNRIGEGNSIPKTSCSQMRDEWLLNQVFIGPFDLGSGSRSPHVMLSTLTARRPRWLIELCKASANAAVSTGLNGIDCQTVLDSMTEFGYSRMQDLSSEYWDKCPQLSEVMGGFTGAPYLFKRAHVLLDYVNKNIIENVEVVIGNKKDQCKAIDIAHLLYYIDFIHARVETPGGGYKHIFFKERPDLLSNLKQALRNDLMAWEIHPMFRNALMLRKENYLGDMPVNRQAGRKKTAKRKKNQKNS